MSGKLGHAILEDRQGRLWVSSRTGLICFDPESGISREDNQKDGLINRQFMGAHLKTRSGEFYFGGTKGLLRFNPDSIHENEFIPSIVLTNFQILNRDVPIRGSPGDKLRWKSPLDKNIAYTDTITLLHWQNDFAFECVQPSRGDAGTRPRCLAPDAGTLEPAGASAQLDPP